MKRQATDRVFAAHISDWGLIPSKELLELSNKKQFLKGQKPQIVTSQRKKILFVIV